MWVRPLAYLSMTVLERQHFVYGTLMDQSVLTTLLGRVPQLTPGTLYGYKRWRIPEQGTDAHIYAVRYASNMGLPGWSLQLVVCVYAWCLWPVTLSQYILVSCQMMPRAV